MKTIIIIPAFNEEKSILSVTRSIKENCPDCDLIVINDCSTDSTAQILDDNNINHIDLCCNLGIGGGVQSGYIYAFKNGYSCAVQMDGDGQHDAKYLKDIIKPIENDDADIVIGSRFITNEGFQSSGMRRAGINFLSRLIKSVSDADIKDVTSGFRAVNQKYIELFAKDYADDYPEPEAIVLSKMSNARIKEVPVIMHERETGVSSISPLKSVYYMIKVSLAIILCKLSYKKGR